MSDPVRCGAEEARTAEADSAKVCFVDDERPFWIQKNRLLSEFLLRAS